MSVRQGNKIIASKPTIDNSVTQDSPNAVSGGGVYTALQGKQATLVSGTNIKTINTNSILGSGDITIDGLPTQTGNSGKLLTTNGTTPSWTAIKTINSGSLVGSGNIDVLVNEATPASSLGVGYTTINTTYADSINIGNGAQVLANNALALGAFASAEGQDSIAIYSSTGTAHRARTTHTGNIAIGYNALAINAAYTIAIGYNAYAQSTNAIQLGTGNNSSSNTMQVWTYKLLDKTTGIVPSARLADTTTATQGQVLTLDSNLDAIWANATAAVAWGNITGTLSDQTDLDNALAGKVSTGHEVIAFQEPNAGNNYTWYRKYADGWVEQGGIAQAAGGGWSYVNLPIEMADTKATVNVSVNWNTTAQDGLKIPTYYMPSTIKIGILIHGRTGQSGVGFYSGEMSWVVSGMAA